MPSLMERNIKLSQQLDFIGTDRDNMLKLFVKYKALSADASRLLLEVVNALDDDSQKALCDNIPGLGEWLGKNKSEDYNKAISDLFAAVNSKDVNEIRKVVGV